MSDRRLGVGVDGETGGKGHANYHDCKQWFQGCTYVKTYQNEKRGHR